MSCLVVAVQTGEPHWIFGRGAQLRAPRLIVSVWEGPSARESRTTVHPLQEDEQGDRRSYGVERVIPERRGSKTRGS